MVDGSRDEAGSGVWGSIHGKVLLGVNLGHTIITNGYFMAYMCISAATRPSSQITLGRIVIQWQKCTHIIFVNNGMSLWPVLCAVHGPLTTLCRLLVDIVMWTLFNYGMFMLAASCNYSFTSVFCQVDVIFSRFGCTTTCFFVGIEICKLQVIDLCHLTQLRWSGTTLIMHELQWSYVQFSLSLPRGLICLVHSVS